MWPWASCFSRKVDDFLQVIDKARAAGGDPASCSCLLFLYRHGMGQREEAQKALNQFQGQLRTPGADGLRDTVQLLVLRTVRPRDKPPGSGGKKKGK